MAAGGSTLTLPILIFLGMDGAMANGTNRIAICLQNMMATSRFHSHGVRPEREGFILAALALPGAIFGAWTAVSLNDEWFQKILAVIMIGVVLSLVFPMKTTSETTEVSKTRRSLSYLGMIGIGFYGGFIQAGVGFLLMATLFHGLSYNLVKVNAHKIFIVLIYTVPVLAFFVWSGKVNWGMGLSLAAGNMIGAWIAAHTTFASKESEKVIRRALIAAILLVSLKLLKVF